MLSQTDLNSKDKLAQARKQCWEAYLSAMRSNTKEQEEFLNRCLTMGDLSMRFYLKKKGAPDLRKPCIFLLPF